MNGRQHQKKVAEKILRKMETNKLLNAYTIVWAIFTPVKGIVTKKDLKNIGFSAFLRNNEASKFYSTKERAKKQISKIKGLSKMYKVVLITDKQFGMSSPKESLLNVATKVQLINTFII